RKADARSAPGDAAMRLLIALARGIERSWSSGFRELGEEPAPVLEALSAAVLPEALEIRRPEGYAFYALYPEGYIQAAQPYSGIPLTIVGLRSIGTGLAAAVAAGAGQEDAITVRPVGHPFRRELALSEDLAAEIKSGSTFAIVDEGPGLSGSSLGCVADFLEDGGIAPRRIHFFPSHAGALGPQASARHRARWARARRPVVGFEALALSASDPPHRIESWVADLCAAPTAPTTELSGGEWRRLRFASEAHWPPANPQQERRKFLLRCQDGPWLLRFAGLGRYGSDKLDLARELASAGFVPPVAGIRHGFTVEPWLEHARPLGAVPQDRSGLVEHLGRYIGTRARLFPADCPGASLEQLATMARRNCELALGDAGVRALGAWTSRLPRLARHVRPVRTDNRLHRWEWLVAGERLVKTDALDHHAAHDLVGCQDAAWDLAGAATEFELDASETERLCTIAERETGRAVVPELLGFLALCYAAFQLGSYSLAADALAGNPGEASRLRAQARRYTDLLRHRLLGDEAARPASPAGRRALGEAPCV
ncbi:MAG TPA: hypothetical protein VJ526_15815, partial [Beijerinckiaceae bacterium]|nr:hypothetical protein [Beijerinckiaceae bacterium]